MSDKNTSKNKLTFEEWFFQCGFHKDGYDCNQVSSAHSAWKFCQAQEQKEISELKKRVEDLEKENKSLSSISFQFGFEDLRKENKFYEECNDENK